MAYENSGENTCIDDFINDDSEDFRYSITSYGVDYTVDRIVNRLGKNHIIIPEFQRQYVWDIKQASRFIESLILGLPVPGVFLSQEKDTNRMLVIDGQQRLLSLKKFYDGKFNGQIFKLKGVQEDLEGRSFEDLTTSDRLKLDDSVIHATVIKQDSPDDDGSSIYMIFERLNTGGMKLVPQEIRACVYHGAFNKMLHTLSNDDNWKIIYSADNKRLKSEELILRYFVLKDQWAAYTKNFKTFLNRYMEENRNIDEINVESYSQNFRQVVKFINNCIGSRAFRIGRNLNAAIYDSVMIATSKLLESTSTPDVQKFKDSYSSLIADQEYRSHVESSTSSQSSVIGRITMAIKKICDNVQTEEK